MRKKIGLALGGGGARGCAHVGVIKALQEAEIDVEFIAGTSIGALVGGIYSVGHIEDLEKYLLQIKWKDVLAQFDPAVMKNGLFEGKKVIKLLDKLMEKKTFRSCKIPYIAVATDLVSGKEVRLNKGKVSDAIRASICLPAVFTAVEKDKYHLLDGGLVNPLPIDVVRDMGADIVIGVDLNHEYFKEKQHKQRSYKSDKWDFSQWMKPKYPNMIDVIEASVFLMQDQITQKNLIENPADLLLQMNLSSATLFDFHKAKELINIGYKAMKAEIPRLKKMI